MPKEDPFNSICSLPTECYKYPPADLVTMIVSGEALGQIDTGEILQSPSTFTDRYNGYKKQSLRGMIDGKPIAWPMCGCGVKHCIRGIPLEEEG